ncbi:MAG: hypothetical protein R3F07_06110 [Opitutaceae bacterium]
MDKREAQFILSAYRPNGRDAKDDRIAAALSLVEGDPELKAWFESEIRQDQVIAEKLRQVRPPAGLRDQILTGMSLAEAAPPWWRGAPAMAIAASLIVVSGLILSWNRPAYESEFAELRANALSYSAGFISLDFFADQVSDLTTWLTDRDAPATTDLIGRLESLPGIGCRTLSWGGKTVSLVCLQGESTFHVFMIDREDLSDDPALTEPQFWQMKGRTVVSWEDAERVYVLVTKASAEAVRALL